MQLPSARRFAGLLAGLTLALCTTGLAQPAMDAIPMASMASMASPFWADRTDRAEAQEMAAPPRPMDDMAMECQPSAQYRPASAPLPPAAHLSAAAVDGVAGSASVQRAPPSPASREGPDLGRLCVSRT